jgi:hypothetical protein
MKSTWWQCVTTGAKKEDEVTGSMDPRPPSCLKNHMIARNAGQILEVEHLLAGIKRETAAIDGVESDGIVRMRR